MYYEIVFLGRKLPVTPEDITKELRVVQVGVDEPEAVRKLLDSYDITWVESISEISRH